MKWTIRIQSCYDSDSNETLLLFYSDSFSRDLLVMWSSPCLFQSPKSPSVPLMPVRCFLRMKKLPQLMSQVTDIWLAMKTWRRFWALWIPFMPRSRACVSHSEQSKAQLARALTSISVSQNIKMVWGSHSCPLKIPYTIITGITIIGTPCVFSVNRWLLDWSEPGLCSWLL